MWFRTFVAWTVRHERWLACAIVAYAVVHCVGRAQREFWFDELFTFYISRLPNLDQIFRAISADGNPPLYYLLAHLSMRLMGETELATRFPAILAFAAGALGTYSFVRRRCGAIPALFALFAVATASAKTYGSEARPYTLLMAFSVLTLVSWQAATEERRSRFFPLAGMALGIAGAIASHHYGIFHVAIPLALGEATRLVRRRKLDLPLYGACVLGASMLIVTAPLMRETNLVLLNYIRESPTFYGRPRIASLESYMLMVNRRLLVVFFALLLLTWPLFSAVSHEPERKGIPAHEVAAAIGLALLVPIMIGITWIATGYYQPRYAIGTTIGIAILLGFAAQRLGRNASHGVSMALLCLVLLSVHYIGADANALIDRLFRQPQHVAEASGGSVLDSAPGREPIVFASPVFYLPAWWYATPAVRERLYYLSDLSFAIRQKDPLPELSLAANQAIVPSRVEDYRTFLTTHRRFLLYCKGNQGSYCWELDNWIRDRLLSEGWTVRPFDMRDDEALFMVEFPTR